MAKRRVIEDGSVTLAVQTPEPVPAQKEPELIKLDLGCGHNKREGFVGVDMHEGQGIDKVVNLFEFPWPFEDFSVHSVFMSHFFEHIPGKLRGKVMDEIYRILANPDTDREGDIERGKVTILSPYWSSPRAIQDYTHEWPPICEWSFLYFNKEWRQVNKIDHYLCSCDFDFGFGYLADQETQGKNLELQAFWIKRYLNAVNDIQVNLTKRPKGMTP